MKQLTILLDLDDVLNNQNEIWVDVLDQRYGRKVSVEDITDWDMRLAFPGLNDGELYGPAHNCMCVCMDKPWNRSAENEFVRAKSFADIDTVVQELEKGDAVEHH